MLEKEVITAVGYLPFVNIGDRINFGKEKLVDAFVTNECIKVYSPVTKYHLNYFSEGMLSMPGGIKGLFNIFDIDLSYTEEGKDAISIKSEFIMTVVETANGRPLTSGEKSILDRCIRTVYHDYQKSGGMDKNTLPTLTTLYELLKAQPEPEAMQLALVLELYVTGSLSSFAACACTPVMCSSFHIFSLFLGRAD